MIFYEDGLGTDTINGKQYPSKYLYNVYARAGKSYVVREKNGKRYMEIGDTWHALDVPTKAQKEARALRLRKANAGTTQYIKINGETYTSGVKGTDVNIDLTANQNYTIINDKKYSNKYSYDFFSKDGETFVVKQKQDGRRYIEIDGSWHKIPMLSPCTCTACPSCSS